MPLFVKRTPQQSAAIISIAKMGSVPYHRKYRGRATAPLLFPGSSMASAFTINVTAIERKPL
jgi:hypothetical protein